jgi:hypothetical protein
MRYTDSYDEDDDFDEAEAEMMADAIAQNNKNHEEQIRLANRQMKHDLLDKAIFISKGWFWGLLPHSVKLHKVAEAYETLKKLTD